jgi:hypothetical protein
LVFLRFKIVGNVEGTLRGIRHASGDIDARERTLTLRVLRCAPGRFLGPASGAFEITPACEERFGYTSGSARVIQLTEKVTCFSLVLSLGTS